MKTAKYFGTDGFRGKAGETLTAFHAFLIGRYLGAYYNKIVNRKSRAVIGKDTRLSSYSIEAGLVAGLTASGADAYLMHVTTTPSVSYITRCDNFDLGIMISASHNPFEDNGIKLFNGKGEKMEDSVIYSLEDYLDERLNSQHFEQNLRSLSNIPYAIKENIGRSVDYAEGRNRYIGHLISLSVCSYKGFKVGLDCANGSAFFIAKSVFDALGATVFCVGDCPNGLNENEKCGSTNIENLQRLVMQKGLDIGFAFDGDADRCIIVDSDGSVVDGDGILFVLANYLLSCKELNNTGIVATVMSNQGLFLSLKNKGVYCVRCKVGDRFVAEKMIEKDYCLGGEQSGHIILSKYETCGDGLVTAIKIMEAICKSKCTLKKLLNGFYKLPQIHKSVAVKNKRKVIGDIRLVKMVQSYKNSVEGVGRIVLRPSGTEDVIRVMVEHEDENLCKNICEEICKKIIEIA
ncbi:MAG: phosphoglucosamine mutase [Clostridiales bacterium]|nr:phosphoglucosamine mutase [Clostridiales bacterium]